MNIHLVLLFLALFCFLLAAVGIPTGRVNNIAVGLFFWVLSAIIR
jgi:hypothetical protein